MKQVYLILAFGFISNSTYAADVYVTGKIGRLMNYQGHQGTLVSLTDMSISSGYCSRNDYFILAQDHPFKDEDYSMLLAAKMSQTTVSIGVSSGNCLDDMPKIKHVFID